MRALRIAGQLRTDLSYPITECDDVVEAASRELVEVLRTPAADVDVAASHHAHRVRMQRLRSTAGTGYMKRECCPIRKECLGHLRTGTVAGAQEQHPWRTTCTRRPRTRRRDRPELEAGMQCSARSGQKRPASVEVHGVVGVPTVGGASPRSDEAAGAQTTEVIRDEALRL